MPAEADLPNFEVSEFGRDGTAFVFDLARLDGRGDIPRPFLHRHSYYHLLWMTNAQGQHELEELEGAYPFFASFSTCTGRSRRALDAKKGP